MIIVNNNNYMELLKKVYIHQKFYFCSTKNTALGCFENPISLLAV